MRFEGKVVIVTGAARGIGAATAAAFAAEGAAVVVNDRLDGQPVVDAIMAAEGTARFHAADVADLDAMERLVGAAVEMFGRLDVFVANAAYSDRGLFHEMPIDKFRRTLDVTMYGAFYGLRAATRQLLRQGGGGNIVVVSSPHAVVAVPRCMPYNMAKAAVDMMVRTAAGELAPDRIRVNAVHPGWTDTPGERKFFTDDEIRTQSERIPWKRLARPAEIARAILFLASGDAEYMTGSTVSVDGGLKLPWA